MLCKFQQTTFLNIFLIFHRKQTDITCKLSPRQFAWNVKAYFQRKVRKNIIILSSAELAPRVVKG